MVVGADAQSPWRGSRPATVTVGLGAYVSVLLFAVFVSPRAVVPPSPRGTVLLPDSTGTLQTLLPVDWQGRALNGTVIGAADLHEIDSPDEAGVLVDRGIPWFSAEYVEVADGATAANVVATFRTQDAAEAGHPARCSFIEQFFSGYGTLNDSTTKQFFCPGGGTYEVAWATHTEGQSYDPFVVRFQSFYLAADDLAPLREAWVHLTVRPT